MFQEEKLTHVFLKQNQEVFVWTCSEMPGLNRTVAIHHLAILLERRTLEQASRHIHPDLTAKIEAQVDKLVKLWIRSSQRIQQDPPHNSKEDGAKRLDSILTPCGLIELG